ncbi:MAG: hypothetical protein QOF37_2669 [Thermoleophilaceae bacterium]|nr:hypothetical protein [Thermoleophilaceae bacterium]
MSKSKILGMLVVLAFVAWPASAAVASTAVLVQPAAGPPGTKVVLTGSGFGRASSVLLSVRGLRAVRAGANRGGRFQTTITVPAGAARSVKITARARGRRVIAYFTVSTAAGATESSEAATARGALVRWSPHAGVAGSRLVLRGSRLARRALHRIAFDAGGGHSVRTGRHGGLKATVAVPQIPAGPHSFRLTGRGTSLRLPFTVLPDPVVAGAGDIACGANSGSAQCKQMMTSDLLLQIAPTAVLALGDTQYENGEYDNFLRFYDPSWGRLKAITYPAVGNHEYGTSQASGCGYACGYFDYWDGPGQMNGRAGARNAGYYAFDVGAWRLYAVNSNCGRTGAPGCGPGSAQLRWLEADLAAHPRACSLMFMHHPLFTSDTRNFDSPQFRDTLRPMWQAFYDHGGDVVLTGHSHFYERYAPQDPQEHPDPAHGIRQFIVGTGGRNVYGVGQVEPTSEVRGVSTFGVIRLGLHASSYDWRFVQEPGKPFTDSGSQACH